MKVLESILDSPMSVLGCLAGIQAVDLHMEDMGDQGGRRVLVMATAWILELGKHGLKSRLP